MRVYFFLVFLLACISGLGVYLALQPRLVGADRIALLVGAASFGFVPLMGLVAAAYKLRGIKPGKSPRASRLFGYFLLLCPLVSAVVMLKRVGSPTADWLSLWYLQIGGIALLLIGGFAGFVFWLDRKGSGGWH